MFTSLETQMNNLQYQINKIQKKLDSLPPGDIFYRRNGKYIKWYVKTDTDSVYLAKSNHELTEKLVYKKQLSFLMYNLQTEYSLIKNLLSSYSQTAYDLDAFFQNNICYRNLLNNYTKKCNPYLDNWLHESYETLSAHPETLIHKTLDGHLVRSKSERLIANTLYQNNIPYRYECLTSFNDVVLAPDFTILQPETNKIIYWEHFGLMDNSHYCDNAISRLKIYTSNGYYPDINLITTFETSACPLSADHVVEIIHRFSLC